MLRTTITFLVLCGLVFTPFAFGLQAESATGAPPPQQAPQANSPSLRAPSLQAPSLQAPSLQALGAVVEQYVSADQAVGAELLVLAQGQVLLHQSYGFADRESGRKWENDTICNIRSMSKPVTSVAAQILIDRQLLNLDDPVAKYLDGFDNEKSNSITVRQVLTHRSGLPLSILLKVDQYPTLAGQVDASGKIGPMFEPGSKFWYSDAGTDVVGRLVEKIAGENLDQFVHREIFEPLEMTNTFYGIDASDRRFASIASLYLGGPKKWNRFWKPDQPLYPCAWGSQTIYSTTTDYARFLKMLMNRGRAGGRQLISEAAVDRMMEPVSRLKMMGSDNDAPTGFRNLECHYGQMLVTHRTIGATTGTPVVLGHSGSDGTNAWAWPANDLMILYFTQSRGGMTPIRIEDSIDSLIINPGKGMADTVPPELAGYLGTYIANYGGFDNEEFSVKVKNGKLVLDVPSQLAFELNGPNENGEWSFAIAPVKVTFDRDASDEVVGLRLHQANNIFEVPKKGTARAEELAKKKSGEKNGPTPAGPDDQDSPSTTWNGTLRTGQGALRLVITVTKTADGLTGELVSPDQGNFRTELADIASDDSVLSFSVPKAQAKFSGKMSADGKMAEGNFTQNGIEMPLALEKSDPARMAEQKPPEKLKEAWVGKLQMGIMEPVMQFRIVEVESGETAAWFDSVTEGRTGFPATWSIEDKTLTFDVAAIKLNYTGTLNEAGDSATGTWSQGGRNVPLILKRQPTEYSSENVWENRPQRPVGPFPYDAEEVRFENQADGLTLAGTMTIPKKPGRHPAVILISGSGPQDRDESLMEHKPFLVLADYLTRRGIAVLRYDDRGFGESTGEFGPATTEDFARDASAAVEFLKSHNRINPSEIGLAGHSEGGLIAPMVVGLRDDVAFVVLLAATGVDGAEISKSQSEAMLRAAGVAESEMDIILSVNRMVVDIAANAGPDEDFTDKVNAALEKIIETLPEADREEGGRNLRAGIQNEMKRLQGNWMRFFLKYDPRPALANIRCPVFAIIGSRDTQVLPDLNMPEIKKALTEGGNQDFETVVLDGLNHLFQKCETGAMGEYISIQETFNPEALKQIGDWIAGHSTAVK